MQSSPLSCYLVPLMSKYPPQHPTLEDLQPVPPTLWETRFHTHIKSGKIRIWYILIFIFLNSKREDKRFCT
jgi:hypothetical protein